MTEQPPSGSYPTPGETPPSGGFPPPLPSGGFPPPLPSGGFPPPLGGYPPPPPGWGYPPPAGQGFPPPPPGGFQGYPPPPPAGGGYFPPPPGFGRPALSVGDGLAWAWNKFTKNALPLVVATLVFGVLMMVLNGLLSALTEAVSPETTTFLDFSDATAETVTATTTPAGMAMQLLTTVVQMVIAAIIGSAYFAGLLDIADGREVTIGSFFRPRNVVSVTVAGLILAVLTTIGLILCILPGLLVSIFTWFTTMAIVDRNLSPMDGIRASFAAVKGNFGINLLFWLTTVAITLVGALLCGIGLLVAAPVAYLLQVYAYRKLSGGSVAPVIV